MMILACAALMISNHYIVSGDTLDTNHGMNEKLAREAIIQAVGCDPNIIRIKCGNVDKGNGASKVCYVDTTYGKFFTTLDYQDYTHIIFVQWE